MVDAELYTLIKQSMRTLGLVIVPSLAVPIAAMIFSVVQGFLAIREETLQYALRAITLTLILMVFGSTMFDSLRDLMTASLK